MENEKKEVSMDSIKKAIAEASEKGQLSSAVTESEDFKAKQKTSKPTTKVIVKQPEPEVEKVRTDPIWPMDDQQVIQWRLDVAERKRLASLKVVEAPISKERLAEIHAQASAAAKKIPSRSPRKEVVVKESRPAKVKKESTRQTRLGQTTLVDALLREGKSEKEVFDAVRIKIPAYPADKLPQLIKLRQYHVKKK